MEVAGHWRREWAGTAEYGKAKSSGSLERSHSDEHNFISPPHRSRHYTVPINEGRIRVTEGGVTRRVARAMEVVHASAPGAQVKVVRAAYHSSSGQGAPAASYLMHSSHSVISSGFNMLTRPSFPRRPLEIASTPTKPLEISSLPLESSPEPNTDTENYKVTEPDDFEFSEPSKWRSSTVGSSLRMPSEESSSTDNASIIDLDARHKNILRKYSYDSENSDLPTYRKNSTRMSPLLDAPEALSTLQYKSLLNGSSDWNSRRKSYSFEDTSPLNESILHNNDTLAMESSTDSGICKSTELVNDADDRSYDRRERTYDKHEDTFRDWLSKNRTGSFYKNKIKPYREHGVVIEEPPETNIALQSKGKISITVPVTVADDYQYKKTPNTTDECDRKNKKVEFCKTELHFIPDTGKVNIIATDEKPPPSNDFRKRRSAFVPMHGTFDKPITLFGENTKELSEFRTSELTNTAEMNEFEENTAATKSILKNKIPKPKPYLLGENMALGNINDPIDKNKESIYNTPVRTAVSLINRQLHERRYNETSSSFSTQPSTSIIVKPYRTSNISPLANDSLKIKRQDYETKKVSIIKEMDTSDSVKNQLKIIQLSPVETRAKTRQLRDSELTYFGVSNNAKDNNVVKRKDEIKSRSESGSIDDLFHSVRLIQRVSNSVCNSEAESDDTPEYQNIPIKTNFAPIPTPKPRSKYDTQLADSKGIKVLRPVIEQDNESNTYVQEMRRSRTRRQEETAHSRSISAPPKTNRFGSIEKPAKRDEQTRSKRNNLMDYKTNEKTKVLSVLKNPNIDITEENEPTYINYSIIPEDKESKKVYSSGRRAEKPQSKTEDTMNEIKAESVTQRIRNYEKQNKESINGREKKHRNSVDTDSLEKKPVRKIRTEKLATPEYSYDKYTNNKTSKGCRKIIEDSLEEPNVSHNSNQQHRSRSSQRNSAKVKPGELMTVRENKSHAIKDLKPNEIVEKEGDVKYHTRNSSKDKSMRKEASNTRKHLDSSYNNKNCTRSKTKDSTLQSTAERSSSKADSHKTSHRSKYVINYDDKNGTVSSICKVKPDASTSKKKKVQKETIIESPKEYKTKNKATEKIALLQLEDHQWDPYEMKFADRKWKRKMHVQRSCQLL